MTIIHITDYDNTIIPTSDKGDDKEEFAKVYRDYINAHPEIEVIYSSGRKYDSIVECINEHNLPKPKYVIGGVGTEIYDLEKKELLPEWINFIKSSNFNAEKVKSILYKHLSIDARPFSTEFKIYYHAFDLTEYDLEKIRVDLKSNHINANLIYSRNKILDIVPSITDKGKALHFLVNLLKFPLKKIAISGDSANDIDMFDDNFGINIVPNNVEPPLLSYAKSLKNFYPAKEKYAKGVIEGLTHFLNNIKE